MKIIVLIALVVILLSGIGRAEDKLEVYNDVTMIVHEDGSYELKQLHKIVIWTEGKNFNLYEPSGIGCTSQNLTIRKNLFKYLEGSGVYLKNLYCKDSYLIEEISVSEDADFDRLEIPKVIIENDKYIVKETYQVTSEFYESIKNDINTASSEYLTDYTNIIKYSVYFPTNGKIEADIAPSRVFPNGASWELQFSKYNVANIPTRIVFTKEKQIPVGVIVGVLAAGGLVALKLLGVLGGAAGGAAAGGGAGTIGTLGSTAGGSTGGYMQPVTEGLMNEPHELEGVLQFVSVDLLAPSVRTGENAQYAATILNSSSSPLAAVLNPIVKHSSGEHIPVEPITYTLMPGETTTIPFNFIPHRSGEYYMEISASAGGIPVSSYFCPILNVEGEQFKIISAKPDKCTLAKGESTSISVEISNTGYTGINVSASAILLKNGEAIAEHYLGEASIAAGTVGKVTGSLTAPESEGEYTVDVVARSGAEEKRTTAYLKVGAETEVKIVQVPTSIADGEKFCLDIEVLNRGASKEFVLKAGGNGVEEKEERVFVGENETKQVGLELKADEKIESDYVNINVELFEVEQ